VTDPQQFREWLSQLAPGDRRYLERHADWKAKSLTFERTGALPPGFVELTMEILEGGSESET
jgi:hypothetical protein